MPDLPLRIAILECDTPLPETRAKYGGYGGVITALLRAGADALSHPGLSASDGLSLTSWDVVEAQAYPPLDAIDAILISGSKHTSYEDVPWIIKLVEFTKTVLAHDRVRVIGVCFGHQIVGRALGAQVGRSSGGWEASVTAVELTEKGQEIFESPALALHQMHRDAVLTLPAGMHLLARTPSCPIQGMYEPHRLLTVQGHPEFTGPIVRELLVARHGLGIFDDAFFTDALARVDRGQDGVVVARAFLRFLLEG